MLQKLMFFCAYVVTNQVYSQKSVANDSLKNKYTIINLSEDDLNDENGEVLNVSGVFSASDDIYLNTVGFDFQGVYYNVRGLGANHITFLLNGAIQNRLYDARPAWNNWGGIDGIYRTQNLTEPLGRSEQVFGSALGVNSLSTKASLYRKGTRVSYASSNRSYQNKLSVLHAGAIKNKWHYVVSLSKRFGSKGYRLGTPYKAESFMLSLEKFFNKNNSLNISFLYTPNKRGLSGAYTNEVLALKSNEYNSYWGYQNGKARSARVRTIKEPLLLLTHSFKNTNTSWQNTFLFQQGTISYSRLDYNGGLNPEPTYYQKLPSYWLSKNTIDFENVYRYQQNFVNNGQLNWQELYKSNSELKSINKNAAYVLYADKRDEARLQFSSNFSKKIKNNWRFNTGIEFRKVVSHNYAEILDLLGGNGYLDVASFTLAQSNVNTPDRVVLEGDKFKYRYKIYSNSLKGFVQNTWFTKRIEFLTALGFGIENHMRLGVYQHENFTDSYGKSQKINLFNTQSKISLLYKFSNKNLVDFKTAYIESSPGLKQIFPNARFSNKPLKDLGLERLFTNSVSYISRGLFYKFKLTGFYNLENNVTETSFYFTEGLGSKSENLNDGLLSENSVFVQEVLYGIKKKYYGIEFGGSYKVSSQIKLKGVVGLGEYTYSNNPNLALYTESNSVASDLGFLKGEKLLGKSAISGKKISTGPQQAFSLKLSYEDPSYWRLNISVNHFRKSYVDIAPIIYTDNFIQELDGSKISGLDKTLVSQFRKQELLNKFTLVNVTGGKSWKLKQNYLSVFYAVQNVLNINYRTGGFSSSRLSNYSEKIEEFNRELPLFGNRYFVGNGRTYFVGVYYSF